MKPAGYTSYGPLSSRYKKLMIVTRGVFSLGLFVILVIEGIGILNRDIDDLFTIASTGLGWSILSLLLVGAVTLFRPERYLGTFRWQEVGMDITFWAYLILCSIVLPLSSWLLLVWDPWKGQDFS